MSKNRITITSPLKFDLADKLLEGAQEFPLFSILELNLTPHCNRKCNMCPRGHGYTDTGKALSLANADKLVNELKKINYEGLIILGGFGEPMLHPKWDELIPLISQGDWTIQLVTNGDLLKNQDQVKDIDLISVSLYDGDHQIKEFNNLLSGLNYELRPWYKNSETENLSSRGGFLDFSNADYLFRGCNYTMYHLFLNHDGRVFTCCHDWSNDFDLGNAFKEGLLNVWNGDKFKQIRQTHFTNRNCKPCKKCDVGGLLSGDKHKQGWEMYYANGDSTF